MTTTRKAGTQTGNVSLRESVERAAQCLRERGYSTTKIGILAGSGLSGVADRILTEMESVDGAAIGGLPAVSVAGQSSRVIMGTVHGTAVIVFGGRKHLYEQVAIREVVFPILLLSKLGASGVILTNAAGAVNPAFRVGQLMLVKDHLDSSFGQFADELWETLKDFRSELTPCYSSPYDPGWLSLAGRIAQERKLDCTEGVYCINRGPFYETPAEVEACRFLGADAVGMSTVPEAIAAHQLGLKVLAVSGLTNMATGMTNKAHSHDEITFQAGTIQDSLACLLDGFLAEC